MTILEEIQLLKKQHDAIILAHNYVDGTIQDIADFTGDSLELSVKAKNARAKTIVFCGVRFMAETAKLLSPSSRVLLPDSSAGCPMASMADDRTVAAYKAAHPEEILVAYVNSTAGTKAHVDVCCTSGNVEKVIQSIPKDKEIMFLPDRNLGENMIRKLKRPMKLWNGFCPIHNKVTTDMLAEARKKHPGAELLVHPECPAAVVEAADQALSTGGMLRYIHESLKKEFIVGTECGILHRLQKENPEKIFYPLEPFLLCGDMKKLTLEQLRDSLRDGKEEILLPAEVMKSAVRPIEVMISL